MAKINWNDCTTAQKAATLTGGIMQFGLLIAALVDLKRRPSTEIRGSKKFWVPFVFVNFIGPIVYFARGRKPAA